MSDGRFTLSGLGDEIDPDIGTQLRVMAETDLRYLELRRIEETNVLDLSPAQIERVHRALDDYGFEISAIASPIGKIDIREDFDPHLERFERAIELADEFDAEYIRLFSYYYPEDDDPNDWREEVMRRMERKVERAQRAGVILVHENERGIYGDVPERCRDIVETVDSPNLRVLFDPANFVVDDIEVYPRAYEELAEHIEYLHIKDAVFADGVEIEPPGEGDADIPEVIEALTEDEYEGFASLEPHLAHAGSEGGFSGSEAFQVAARAFTAVLDDIGASYE
jgi:sugar phosphate isomerase/epimerase